MKESNITIMGIVNLNDDSFYAPSRSRGAAVAAKVEKMLEEGAGIIDLGAVSSRPGASEVSLEEEWERLSGGLDALKEAFSTLPDISVDTTRSEIVRRVYSRIGRFTVNDISAGEQDPLMLRTAAELGLPFIAMHNTGPADAPASYPRGVVAAVADFFEGFSRRAGEAGLGEWILDPGFGFSKTVGENYELLAGLGSLLRFGRPVLAGVSRKSFIYRPLGITPEEALAPTQVIHAMALERGATILRVHDVKSAVQTVSLFAFTK